MLTIFFKKKKSPKQHHPNIVYWRKMAGQGGAMPHPPPHLYITDKEQNILDSSQLNTFL